MALNDMYVVMYKIIAYLYDCMKSGVNPSAEAWNATALGIPESYWTRVIEQLVSHGYVDGIGISRADNQAIVICAEPFVTMEGVAFAQENSMMGKAKQFLIDAKSAIPFV